MQTDGWRLIVHCHKQALGVIIATLLFANKNGFESRI